MTAKENELVAIESRYSGTETVQRIEAALRSKGLTIFAIIDHSGEAERVGLSMPFTQVILFGSPKAGTPLMIASPTLAIDLPLKALVLEHEPGHTTVYFNTPEYLRERHSIPCDLLPNIAGAGILLQKAIE
jgi:uncharacterized protein (DUF302 family)